MPARIQLPSLLQFSAWSSTSPPYHHRCSQSFTQFFVTSTKLCHEVTLFLHARFNYILRLQFIELHILPTDNNVCACISVAYIVYWYSLHMDGKKDLCIIYILEQPGVAMPLYNRTYLKIMEVHLTELKFILFPIPQPYPFALFQQ